MAVPVTVITLGMAVSLIVNVNNGGAAPSASSPVPGGDLAGQDFTPYSAGSTRGIALSEGRVASSGPEIVAVGAETGQSVPRAQFFSLGGRRPVLEPRHGVGRGGGPATRARGPLHRRRTGGMGRRRP